MKVSSRAALIAVLRSRVLSAALALAASVCPIGIASAADGAAADPQSSESSQTLQEVVITATKRRESILEVPISVTAVSSADIEARGDVDILDVSRAVPGIEVERAGNEQQDGNVYVFRGMNAAGNTSLSAVYIDDVPITFGAINPGLNLFDLDRVEVLRGPQGTLFGDSAMSGAIRYITPQPDFTNPAGFVRGEYGEIDHGGTSNEEEVVYGAPIVSDALAFRASMFKRHDGGYIDSISETTGAIINRNINSTDSIGGRFALAGKIGNFQATLSVLAQQSDQNALQDYYQGFNGFEEVPPFQIADREPQYSFERILLPSLTLQGDLGFANLVSVSSYLDRHWELQNDFSFFLQSIFGGCCNDEHTINQDSDWDRAFTQEVRLTSKSSETFQWLIGAYYRSTQEISGQGDFGNVGSGDNEPGLAQDILPGGTDFEAFYNTKREQRALFGNASYNLFDWAKLTGGVRISDLDRSELRVANGFFNGGPSTSYIGSSDHNVVTPMFSVSHSFGSAAMPYFTYATGFREGDVNGIVPVIPNCVEALTGLGISQAPSTYASDRVKSFEVGVKGQTPHQELMYAVDVYHVNWTDLQQQIVLGDECGYSFTTNTGTAVSQGMELETSWQPVSHLEFGFNAGYNEAYLTSNTVIGSSAAGLVYGTKSGTALSDFPKWTISAHGQYGFPITSQWNGSVRADYQYIGASTNTPQLGGSEESQWFYVRTAYAVVSARVSASIGLTEIAVLGKNLTNARPILSSNCCGEGPTNTTPPQATIGFETLQPRYVALILTHHFY